MGARYLPGHVLVLVAVTAGRWPKERYSLHRGYLDGVRAVGATPVVVPAGAVDDLGAVLDVCGALIVTGGGDVEPACYGEAPAVTLMEVDQDRDALEVAAVHGARARSLPVLGICRGAQVLAVALGGSLHQDLPMAGFPSHWHEDRQNEAVHDVMAENGSLASEALAGATRVNSIHHQAIARVGPELEVTARCPDGVIEAVEGERMLGLQWHPERLLSDPRHLAPFEWLVKAAS